LLITGLVCGTLQLIDLIIIFVMQIIDSAWWAAVVFFFIAIFRMVELAMQYLIYIKAVQKHIWELMV
jgi:hypothetical protein